MKTIIMSSALIGTLFLFSAFFLPTDPSVIGSYGVCESDPSQILLVLKEDHSFTYQDVTGKTDKQMLGTWTQKGQMVYLHEQNNSKAFHNKWRISVDGKAKARKGLLFYSLHKLEK